MPSDPVLLPPGPERKLLPAPRKVSRIHPWRIALIAVILLIVIFAIGYIPRHKRQKVVEAAAEREAHSFPTANFVKVKPSTAISTLLLPGNITPLTEAYIYARATGYVRRRYADIGDHVREGQLLADIEAPDLDAQVAQAQATLAQSDQQLTQARAALENATAQEDLTRATWQRYQVLVSHGAVSRQDADQQFANYRTAQANVHMQEAGIRTAEENIHANRANLDRLVALQAFEQVRAPFSGVITARNFDVGAFINGGGATSGASTTPMGGTQAAAQFGNAGATGASTSQSSSPTSPSATGAPGAGSSGELFRVAQIATLRILVNVPQENAPTVRVGQPATVFVQEYSKQKFTGQVTRTSSSLDQSSRTLLTEVQVPNANFLLLPGMYAQVQFADLRPSPPLLLPGDAVLAAPGGLEVAVLRDLTPEDRRRLEEQQAGQNRSHKETDQQRQAAQRDVQQAKRVHLQKVEVGRDYGTEIEISAGLNGSESVVVNPGDEVQEGAIVIPRNAPPVEGQNASQQNGQEEREPSGIGSPSMDAPTQAPSTKSKGNGKNGSKGKGESKK